jgi:hypothetical protein
MRNRSVGKIKKPYLWPSLSKENTKNQHERLIKLAERLFGY